MKRKSHSYTHFGINFSSPKDKFLTLENFIEREPKETTTSFFENLIYKNNYMLYNKNDILPIIEAIKKENDTKKEKHVSSKTRLIDYWCNKIIIYFNEYYSNTQKDERYKKWLQIKDKVQISFEQFNSKFSLYFTKLLENYDFSNGSYLKPLVVEKELQLEDQNLRINFLINMSHYNELNKEEFCKSIEGFLNNYPFFEEVVDLTDSSYETAGYYIFVLDKYMQIYVGQTTNFKKRVIEHWKKIMPRNRRIFGTVQDSKISIDSFCPFDISRILFAKDDALASEYGFAFSHEDELINFFNNKFISNRVEGGWLPLGLDSATKKKITN